MNAHYFFINKSYAYFYIQTTKLTTERRESSRLNEAKQKEQTILSLPEVPILAGSEKLIEKINFDALQDALSTVQQSETSQVIIL